MALAWPWNLEFGSPPSTLSCHLSLKNEYEYEEKYTATSVQGSKEVLKEGGRLGNEGRRHSLQWFQGHCASGGPRESGTGSRELDVHSSCRAGWWCRGCVRREGAVPVPPSRPLWAAEALATQGPPVAPTDAQYPSRAAWAPSREGVLLFARLSAFTESEITWKKTMHFP